MKPELKIKIDRLCEKISEDLKHHWKTHNYAFEPDKAVFKEGNKYIKIDIANFNGSTGRGSLMVEVATERIYGIKAYGVIHKGRYYGTLSEINSYYWGNYYPQKFLVKQIKTVFGEEFINELASKNEIDRNHPKFQEFLDSASADDASPEQVKAEFARLVAVYF
jgi:hypothetical protein